MKNEILKYLGIFVILLGVVLLTAYFFGIFNSNKILLTAGFFVCGGAVAHVILNKYLPE